MSRSPSATRGARRATPRASQCGVRFARAGHPRPRRASRRRTRWNTGTQSVADTANRPHNDAGRFRTIGDRHPSARIRLRSWPIVVRTETLRPARHTQCVRSALNGAVESTDRSDLLPLPQADRAGVGPLRNAGVERIQGGRARTCYQTSSSRNRHAAHRRA